MGACERNGRKDEAQGALAYSDKGRHPADRLPAVDRAIALLVYVHTSVGLGGGGLCGLSPCLLGFTATMPDLALLCATLSFLAGPLDRPLCAASR